MRVDVGLESLELLGRGRALQSHRPADRLEPRANRLVDGEEPAQVDVALQRHGDRIEWNAEMVGMESIGDLLAGRQCSEREFDGVGRRVRPAEG